MPTESDDVVLVGKTLVEWVEKTFDKKISRIYSGHNDDDDGLSIGWMKFQVLDWKITFFADLSIPKIVIGGFWPAISKQSGIELDLNDPKFFEKFEEFLRNVLQEVSSR